MNFDNRLGPYRIKMLELARYSGRSSVSASRRPRKKAYPPRGRIWPRGGRQDETKNMGRIALFENSHREEAEWEAQ